MSFMDTVDKSIARIISAASGEMGIGYQFVTFVLALLILVGLLFGIYSIWNAASKKTFKSKFNTDGFDKDLVISVRGDLQGYSHPKFQMGMDYLKNLAAASGVELRTIQEEAGDMKGTLQILYVSGLESFFRGLPSRTILGTLSLKDGVMSSLLDQTTFFFTFSSTDASVPSAFVQKLITEGNGRAVYVQDTSLPPNTVVMRLTRVVGGTMEDGEWFNEFPNLPIEVLRFPVSRTELTTEDKASGSAAIEKARVKRPEPVFKATFVVEYQSEYESVANSIRDYIKNSSRFKDPGFNVTISKSTSPGIKIILSSLETNLNKRKIPISLMTLPLVLVYVPESMVNYGGLIFDAFDKSFAVYWETILSIARRDVPGVRSGGPTVIRLEGDVDPLMVRGRLELMNFSGETEREMLIIYKYVQNKNPKRPIGSVSAYLESFDEVHLAGMQDELRARIKNEFKSGTFLGNVEAHLFINGPAAVNGPSITNNPLLANEALASTKILPWVAFVTTNGKKPSEDDVLRNLGCPTPDSSCPTTSCPACPKCTEAGPCPSCPLWDPSKVAPKENVIEIISNSTMTNRSLVVPTLSELIRARLAFVNKNVTFKFTTKNTGQDSVNNKTIRIKVGTTYNKWFTYPANTAGLRTLTDALVKDLTPLLV